MTGGPRRADTVDQVAAVNDQAVSWQRKRVLNHNEGLVHACACAVVKQINPGWQVWPQVSLGEVLRTEGWSKAGRQAFRWINSKRADFLVADAAGWPMAVIEYQGTGHPPRQLCRARHGETHRAAAGRDLLRGSAGRVEQGSPVIVRRTWPEN